MNFTNQLSSNDFQFKVLIHEKTLEKLKQNEKIKKLLNGFKGENYHYVISETIKKAIENVQENISLLGLTKNEGQLSLLSQNISQKDLEDEIFKQKQIDQETKQGSDVLSQAVSDHSMRDSQKKEEAAIIKKQRNYCAKIEPNSVESNSNQKVSEQNLFMKLGFDRHPHFQSMAFQIGIKQLDELKISLQMTLSFIKKLPDHQSDPQSIKYFFQNSQVQNEQKETKKIDAPDIQSILMQSVQILKTEIKKDYDFTKFFEQKNDSDYFYEKFELNNRDSQSEGNPICNQIIQETLEDQNQYENGQKNYFLQLSDQINEIQKQFQNKQ